MRKLMVVALAVSSLATIPQLFEEQLLHRATAVLQHVLDAPRPAIPQDVLARARAVVVLPAVAGGLSPDRALKMAGVLSARGATLEHWSPPALVELRGRLAIVDAADVILIAQTARGLDALMAEGEGLLGSVGIAPGPLSDGERNKADLLAYVRFDNYFGGVAIDEWSIESSNDGNAALYGKGYSTEAVVRGQGFFQLRPAARAWREMLADLFRQAS